MSEEQLRAFLEKVKADTSLQEKLKAAADAEAVVEIARKAGFSIATEELKVRDDELERAGGGACEVLTGPVIESYVGDSWYDYCCRIT